MSEGHWFISMYNDFGESQEVELLAELSTELSDLEFVKRLAILVVVVRRNVFCIQIDISYVHRPMHKIGCGSFNAKRGAENENAFLWVSISIRQTIYQDRKHIQKICFLYLIISVHFLDWIFLSSTYIYYVAVAMSH